MGAPKRAAHLFQQRAGLSVEGIEIEVERWPGAGGGQLHGALVQLVHLDPEGAARETGARLDRVPEDLVEGPQDIERLEHGRADRRVAPPRAAVERPDRPLAGAEAVVGRAAGESLVAEPRMDAAAQLGGQVGAGLPGRLADGEVGRYLERRRHAAQRRAGVAVGPQVGVVTNLVLGPAHAPWS